MTIDIGCIAMSIVKYFSYNNYICIPNNLNTMRKISIFILLLAAALTTNAQTYYSMHYCKEGFRLRMYETILPTLLHIKDVAEKGGDFKADEYYEAIDILCNIYTHYYKNPEMSLRIMEKAYQTLAAKTDSSHSSSLRFAALNLADIYTMTCQYDKAGKCIQNSEKLFDIAPCNCNLRLGLEMAKIKHCCTTKNTAKLRPLINNVITKYKDYYETDLMKGTDYLTFALINSIAEAHYLLGETDKAVNYWQHIVDNLKSQEPQPNALFNKVINSLATIKMQNRQWTEALALYDKIKMFNDYYNEEYFYNVLNCALFANNVEKIKKYYTLFSREMVENKSRILIKSTEENHYNAWVASVKDVEFYNYAALKSQMAPIITDAFASTVFFKSLSLNSNIILNDFIYKSDQKDLINTYEKCKKLKHNFVFSHSDLETKKRDYLEYELLFDSVLTQTQRLSVKLWNQVKTYSEIQRPLSENEFVIEFCLIPDYEQYPNHHDYFGAYVFGKNFSMPKLIKLGEVDAVAKILTPSTDAMMFYSHLYSPEKSRLLYDLIFKPLESFLRTARTVYFSPYGILANVSFNFLADSDGKYLCNKFNMVRVSSVTQISQIKSRNITVAKSAALFGDIDYGTAVTDRQNAGKQSSNRESDFSNLPSTKIEIQKIKEILSTNHIEATIFDRTSATEESFKNLSGKSPEILHLATHGFCFETDEKAADKPFAQNVNSYSQKESAMVLSGLALSGANNIWKGNFDLPNAEDGILTAYEISQLDLSNTRLAVLSACETARGRIFPVDGVFGLQRAFKQAGAGSILMSLWKVDDAATALFMEHFYKFLFETHDRHAALKMAQSEVKKQHPDPYYWAAWVMLD